ncbi:MAG: N-acetyltransferase family protein [Sphingomonas sp.]
MIAYRPATLNDGPKLDAMAKQAWLETFEHSTSPQDIALYVGEAYGPQGRLIASLADPAQRFQLAWVHDDIAGYAKLSPLWLDDPVVMRGAVQLSQLYVASGWHGKGIAQALMDWTINEARSRGAPALVLTVWEDNFRARRFYDKYGFTHIGDYPYPTGNQIDRDLIMQLLL